MSLFSRRPKNDHDVHNVELLAKSALSAIKNPPSSAPSNQREQWHRRLYVGLKSLGLSAFIAWARTPEKKKTAIHKDRRTAAIRCLVHLIPVLVAMALLTLNFSSILLTQGGIGSQVSTTLQFAAKAHEMVMVASLATTLLSFLCYHLNQPYGLPFGAALANLQAMQLSYIISPEILGTLRSRQYTRKFRCYLFSVLLIVSVLMATVGPASAACMIPRLRQWTVKKQDFFSAATSDELFPVDLIGSSYQPTKGQFGDRVGPPHEREYLTLLDAYNNQTASGDTQMGLWKIDQLDYPLTLTNECGTTSCTASIQNSLLATIYDSKNWSAPALIEARVEGAMDAQSEVQCIADDAIRLDSSVRPTELKFRLGQEEVTGRLRQEDTENLAPSPERGAFCWLIFADMPENATLGGVVVVTSSWGDEPATLYPCAFQLRWTPTTLQYSVSAISSQPSPHSAQVRKVRASRSWLDTFASARWNGSSAYESLTNGQKYVVWPDADYASDWLFTILPVLLAVALSRTADPAASEDLWHFDRTRPDAPVFKVAFFKQGYGWGPESLAIRISLAILLLYCLIAIGHTIYSIYTGLSSTAWDSISEVAALALNSPTPTEMLNTRAGIKTAAVFEHRVRITAMAEDKDNSDEGESADSDGTMDGADPVGTRLALLFPSDEDKIASNVRVNTVY